jgi:hypothetical protein
VSIRQHGALQWVRRGVAAGLEIPENIALGVETLEMRAVDVQKHKLYGLTSKVIEDVLQKLGGGA